jgi:hypothetical protein
MMADTIPPFSMPRIDQLRGLRDAIQKSLNGYIEELEKNPLQPDETSQRFLVTALGRLNSLIVPAKEQLVLISGQHLEARALHVIAAADVAGLIEREGESGRIRLEKLADATGLETGKLGKAGNDNDVGSLLLYLERLADEVLFHSKGRLLRLLCSLHVFSEPEHDVFANTELSAKLVADKNFRAWVVTL